jgi:hypothetical protein
LIGSKQKSLYSSDEIKRWLSATALAEMVMAGPIEEKHSRSSKTAQSLGGFKLAHVSDRVFSYLIRYYLIFYDPQSYRSRKAGDDNGFLREQYNCPYRNECACVVAVAVKNYDDRDQMYISWQHTMDSHADGRRAARGLLSVKQRAAVGAAVKYQPLMVGSQVHANLKNRSPGKHVPSDKRSTAAVDRLVRKERIPVFLSMAQTEQWSSLRSL